MNKKIILSLSIIGIAAAIAIGGTVAYFSDTETSTGNILTAGSIDLKVDHLAQTYGDLDCNTASVQIVSDTTNMVTGTLGGIDDPSSFPHPAVLVSPINSAWTAIISDASWIWWTNPTPEEEKGIDTIYTFEKTFTWMGPITDATLNLNVGTDNSYQVFLNGHSVGADPDEWNFTTALQDTYSGAQISPYIDEGLNTLEIKVKNWARPAGATWDNPGGLLYKLVIDGNPTGDYFKAHCKLWGEKDLVAGDTFFNFVDVKPGDSGTNVISLHVYNNDAWVCMSTANVDNTENGLQEPELKMVPADNDTTGELGQNIHIFMWRDANGNGIYDVGESSIGSYALAGNSIIPLYDSGTGTGALVGSNTVYVGLAWCAGALTPAQGSAFLCNGSSMDNYSQSDKVTADLIFRAEQARNQDSFTCVATP